MWNIRRIGRDEDKSKKNKVKNVRPTSTQTLTSWNAYQWRVK